MREEHVGLARQDQLDFEPAPGQPRHLAQGAAGRQKAGADNRNLPCAFEVSAQGQFDRIVPARAGEKNLAPGECEGPLPSRFAQAGKRLCLRLARQTFRRRPPPIRGPAARGFSGQNRASPTPLELSVTSLIVHRHKRLTLQIPAGMGEEHHPVLDACGALLLLSHTTSRRVGKT